MENKERLKVIEETNVLWKALFLSDTTTEELIETMNRAGMAYGLSAPECRKFLQSYGFGPLVEAFDITDKELLDKLIVSTAFVIEDSLLARTLVYALWEQIIKPLVTQNQTLILALQNKEAASDAAV